MDRTFRFADIHKGLGYLVRMTDFDNYEISSGILNKFRELSMIDEGVYFYSLLGYMESAESRNHPLYDGTNRVYTAYLIGLDRIEELNCALTRGIQKLSQRCRLTLAFVLAYQYEATFFHIGVKKNATTFPWETYVSKGTIWTKSREEVLSHVIENHWCLENRAYRSVLVDMIRIMRLMYVEKDYPAIVKVFDSHRAIAKLRG